MNQILMNPDQQHPISRQEAGPQFETGQETQPTQTEQAIQQFEQQPEAHQAAPAETMHNNQPSVVETNFHSPVNEVLASRHQYMERFAFAQSFQPAGILGVARRAIMSFRMENVIAREHQEIKRQEAEMGGQILTEFDPLNRSHSCHVEEPNLIIWICDGKTTFIREMEGVLKARVFDIKDEYEPLAEPEEHIVYNWLSHYRQRVAELHR